nr:hypothetical protein [Arthrobacter sp. 260]
MTAEQQAASEPAAEPAPASAVVPTTAEQLAQQAAAVEETAPAVVTPVPQSPAAVQSSATEPAAATPAVVAEAAAAAAPPTEVVAPPATKSPEDKPVKDSFYHSKESHRRLRSTYLETRHLTKYKSLSDFISSLIDQECTRLEELYNNGEPFSTDPNEMPRGRPVDG